MHSELFTEQPQKYLRFQFSSKNHAYPKIHNDVSYLEQQNHVHFTYSQPGENYIPLISLVSQVGVKS